MVDQDDSVEVAIALALGLKSSLALLAQGDPALARVEIHAALLKSARLLQLLGASDHYQGVLADNPGPGNVVQFGPRKTPDAGG